MDVIIYEIPAFDGNPNGKIVAPIGTLFYKNGIVYRINYGGFQSSDWPRVYFQNKRTPTEVESLGIVDTGIYLYLKETNPNSSSGWKLFSRKDIFMSYVTPVTPTVTPTPTSTPTETPTPTPTATPTPTPIMPPMDAFSSYQTGSITLADGGQGWLHDGVFGVVDYYTIAVIDAFSSYQTGSIILADGGQNWATNGTFTTT